MIVNLVRLYSVPEGTFGTLFIMGEKLFTSVELPWKNNDRGVSCIPTGEYECAKVNSPRFGDVYQVRSVPGRSHILFHVGNFAGDRDLGWKSNSDGCILLGSDFAVISGQRAVRNSRKALNSFHEVMDSKDFTLVVSEFKDAF